MANFNLYATLADYKNYAVSRGNSPTNDGIDDAVILDLLEEASRHLDDVARRQFYPTIETRLYDIPRDSELLLDQDLLSLTTLTNGDASVISSTNYTLLPSNDTPKYSVKLKGDSTVAWEADSDNDTEQVISVLGWWGFRKQFSTRAWQSIGTLSAAITDTTTLAFTMTAGHSAQAGQILKIDSEIYNVSTVSTNTVTPFARGDNGSTAATHSNGATVYRWVPQEKVRIATLEKVAVDYARRFGRSISETAQVTAAGIVLAPNGDPQSVADVVIQFGRLV